MRQIPFFLKHFASSNPNPLAEPVITTVFICIPPKNYYLLYNIIPAPKSSLGLVTNPNFS